MTRTLRRRLLRAAVLTLLSLAAAAGAVSAGATAAPQPTLTGEEFLGTPRITFANCTPTGPSRFTYTVSGIATGPYPGRFTEFGTVETLERTRSLVSNFRAVFTITPDPADPSPTFRRVVGAKTLLAPLSGEADCESQAPGDVNRFSLFVTHRYAAAIEAEGSEECFDRGIGSIQMLLVGPPEDRFAEFREDFFSDFTFTTGQAVCDDD